MARSGSPLGTLLRTAPQLVPSRAGTCRASSRPRFWARHSRARSLMTRIWAYPVEVSIQSSVRRLGGDHTFGTPWHSANSECHFPTVPQRAVNRKVRSSNLRPGATFRFLNPSAISVPFPFCANRVPHILCLRRWKGLVCGDCNRRCRRRWGLDENLSESQSSAVCLSCCRCRRPRMRPMGWRGRRRRRVDGLVDGES